MTQSQFVHAVSVAVAIAVVLLTWPPGSALAVSPGYVALGDSIEAGFGATNPDDNGWVPLFSTYLKAPGNLGPNTDLVNLGTPDATARDIQLTELVPAREAIDTDAPVVVSWGGGGNDLLDFIRSPQAATCLRGSASCLRRLNALLNEMEQTIDLTVKQLRATAGPDAKILLRTQYNPLLKRGCDPTGTQAALAAVVLEGEAPPRLTRGLNDRIRDVATRYGARVIEIYQVFAVMADAYIAADCVHPSDRGHRAIADAAQLAF
jgi:lysophospholipase L1-like esterase